MKNNRQPSKASDVSKTEKAPKVAKVFKASKTMKASKVSDRQKGSRQPKTQDGVGEQKEQSKPNVGEMAKSPRNFKGSNVQNDIKGVNGQRGKMGSKDSTKAKGFKGPKGPKGQGRPNGPKGPKGQEGPKGQKGQKGPKGQKGSKGTASSNDPQHPKNAEDTKNTAVYEPTATPTDLPSTQEQSSAKEVAVPITEEPNVSVPLLDQSSLAQLIRDDLSTYTGSKMLKLSNHEIETLGQLSNLEHVNRLDLSGNKLKSVRVSPAFGILIV